MDIKVGDGFTGQVLNLYRIDDDEYNLYNYAKVISIDEVSRTVEAEVFQVLACVIIPLYTETFVVKMDSNCKSIYDRRGNEFIKDDDNYKYNHLILCDD